MPCRKRSPEAENGSIYNKLLDLARVTLGSLDSIEQQMPEAAPEGFLFAAPRPNFEGQYHPGGGNRERAAQFRRAMPTDEYGCEPKDQSLTTN